MENKEAAAPGDNKTSRIKAALFDFDGTISVIRQGWETVMAPFMLEIISGRPADQASSYLKEMVHAYIEKSTGIQTIEQMIWLTEKAESLNVNPDRPKDPWQCKDIYIKRLHQHIQYRRQELSTSEVEPDRYRVAGCAAWLAFLKDQDITMYLASGSDEKDVIEEADLLGDFEGS